MKDNYLNKLMWPIDTIKENPTNGTIKSELSPDEFEMAKHYLREEGQLGPILVDIRADHYGEIIGGHTTLKALKANGETMVWVEPKTPRDDAHAFKLGLLHNMQFTHYLKDKLSLEAKKHEAELVGVKVAVDPQASIEYLITSAQIKMKETQAKAEEVLHTMQDQPKEPVTAEPTPEAPVDDLPPEPPVVSEPIPTKELTEEQRMQITKDTSPQSPEVPAAPKAEVKKVIGARCPYCKNTFDVPLP